MFKRKIFFVGVCCFLALLFPVEGIAEVVFVRIPYEYDSGHQHRLFKLIDNAKLGEEVDKAARLFQTIYDLSKPKITDAEKDTLSASLKEAIQVLTNLEKKMSTHNDYYDIIYRDFIKPLEDFRYNYIHEDYTTVYLLNYFTNYLWAFQRFQAEMKQAIFSTNLFFPHGYYIPIRHPDGSPSFGCYKNPRTWFYYEYTAPNPSSAPLSWDEWQKKYRVDPFKVLLDNKFIEDKILSKIDPKWLK
ncbi:MAG: hypothetical protein WA705_18730 [Candidatus Ozemobacteraceae bacterium]